MKEKLWHYLKIIIINTVFILAVSIGMEGMWLFGIPEIEDVQAVQITDLRHSQEAKEFTDAESIELAVKLSGFLRYKLLKVPQSDSEPITTITYVLSDGSTKSLSANENTVWWKGKAYCLKQERVFLNLTEGIFFYEEAVAAEQANK